MVLGFDLTGSFSDDQAQITALIAHARNECSVLPEDPFVTPLENHGTGQEAHSGHLPAIESVSNAVFHASQDMDLAGLYAGGKVPVILIQNTGLMESGDSMRGWTMGMNIPVVLMVGYRGYTRHGVNKDTAATYTEPFLNAFQIQFYLVENSSDAPRISVAFEEAKRNKRPVAVLIGDEYHGFNR